MMEYVCPLTRETLSRSSEGLRREDGVLYPYIDLATQAVPDFMRPAEMSKASSATQAMYESENSGEIYRNFLDWLFTSFETEEATFRRSLLDRLHLKQGQAVLVTGCGLGEDLPIIAERIRPGGKLYAQDLSKSMVLQARQQFVDKSSCETPCFSVGDAMKLPFRDGFFDAVFHFGGINLFEDLTQAIAEMTRVVRPGGRVVFGDEGIGPWLGHTEYRKVAVCNNPLWASEAPLSLLPYQAVNVNCSWVLGNCFYVIDFEVSSSGPHMNVNVPHKGRRGGTARTRYFGQLEGVTPETRLLAASAAAREGLSLHEWLERLVTRATNQT